MKQLNEHLDTASIIVMVITFILFTVALFTKGFTHDLFLEAAVFLVSVKVIMSTYKLKVDTKNIRDKLHEIHEAIKEQSSDKKN